MHTPFIRLVECPDPSGRTPTIGLLVLLAVALGGVADVAASTLGKSPRTAPSAQASLPATNRSVAETSPALPPFAFHDQQGRVVANGDLLGQVWIADFIYTSCESACPLLTARLVAVQRRLPDPRLKFVSFSVDPRHDTPEVLARYARRWHGNERRWRLLSTDVSGLARLTSDMKVDVSLRAGDLVHSDRLFLIDAQGKVADSFDSADDVAVDRLVSDAGRLLGAAPATAVPGASGAELFSSLGCAGCHDDPRLAPPLAGLFGARVMLERGTPVFANDDYIRESITKPASQLVAGFPSSMPAYGAMLSSSQVGALVGYVRSLRGTHLSDAAMSQTDPVCGMPTRVTKATPWSEYEGETYHFCSSTCARQFQANPAKYVHGK